MQTRNLLPNGIELPSGRGSLNRRTYRYYRKLALRDNNKITLIECYPDELRDYVLKVRKAYKKKKAKYKHCKALDKRIFIHKWYPWSYWGYHPRVVPQGWYSLKLAKQKYIDLYGKENLRHVKWIKGKEALERDFKVGKRLFIGNRWVPIRIKTYFIPNIGTILSQIVANETRNDRIEEKVIKTTKILSNDQKRVTISKNKSKKRLELPLLQKAKQQRAKDLYEE